MIYLATSDKVIEEKKKEVEKANAELIRRHKEKPFLTRCRTFTNTTQMVTQNLINFDRWMTHRINNMRHRDDRMEPIIVGEDEN